MAKDISVEIGFVGGGGTAIGIPEDGVEAFTKSLTAGETWHTITSSDGATFFVDMSKIVFVRVAATNRSIGFAHA